MSESRSPQTLFDRIGKEIEQKPTNRENARTRFQTLVNLARMLLAEIPRDDVLLPKRYEWIVALLESQCIDQASEAIDSALLELCELGRTSSLANLRKVAFSGLDGVRIAGYLLIPDKPSKHGLVWGHGGFTGKEAWVDVATEISQAGIYVLVMDFEGCGESEGYTRWIGRIKAFSYGIDYLEEEWGLSRFGVGGHSGGGAYPASCAAIEDERISLLVLWDCMFDFYDIHIIEGALDPGSKPHQSSCS